MCKDDPARRNQAAVIVAIRAGNHVHCLHELTTVTVRVKIDGNRRMLVIRSIGGEQMAVGRQAFIDRQNADRARFGAFIKDAKITVE